MRGNYMLRKIHAPILMERIARCRATHHLPSARVSILQRIVEAIGVAVETLRVVGALHIGIHREERRHLWVVHAAIHVNQTEGIEMLMASKATVEHGRGQLARSLPGLRVAAVAPSVKAQLLLHITHAISNCCPASKIVFQNVVNGFHITLLFHHCEHTYGTAEVSENLFNSGVFYWR